MHLIVILLLSCLTQAEHTAPIIVTALPDGISIRGDETLHQLVASWDVYVTLDPLLYLANLVAQIASWHAQCYLCPTMHNQWCKLDH